MDNHLVLPPLNYDSDVVGGIDAVGGSTMEQSIASSVDENLKFFDIGRAIELNRAKQKATPVYDDYIDPYSGESYPDPSKEIPKKLLAAEEANRKYGIPDNGLTFNEPITEEAARILNYRKKQEIYNQEIIAQAQGWRAVGGFTMGMVASLAQPEQFALNILGSVVAGPILGAKYATQSIAALNPLSRIGARAVAGTVEGLVGSVVAEPIQMAVANTEYADYGMMDTLANLAGGAVLGGGLHVVGGTTADWVKGMSKTTWSQGLDAAVRQLISGKPVEVEPIVRQDPSAILKAEMQAMMMPGEPAVKDVAATQTGDPDLVANIKSQLEQLPIEINTAESFMALQSVMDSGVVGFRIERDFAKGHSVTINGKKYVLGDLETDLKILDPTGADKDRYVDVVNNAVSSDFDGDKWKLFKAPKRVVVKYGNQFLIINGKELLTSEQGATFEGMSVGLAVKIFEKYGILVSFSKHESASKYDGKGVMLGEVYEGIPTDINVLDRKSASEALYKDIVSHFHSLPNGYNSVPNQLSVDVTSWLDRNDPIDSEEAFLTHTKDVAKIPDEMIGALAGGTISDTPAVSQPTDLLFSNLTPLDPSQLGSNEGGRYVDPTTGIEYYVKRNKTNAQTFTEIAANLIYQYLDILVPSLQRVDFGDGTFGVASMWQDGKPATLKEIKNAVADMAYDYALGSNPIADPWIVDAWLANWDAFAEGNFLDSFDGGMRIDQGGALEFRAQGEKKTNFGPVVEELESFFTVSQTYPKILKEIGITGTNSAIASLARNVYLEAMKRLDASALSNALLEGGYSGEEAKRLSGILVARRDYIVARAEGVTPPDVKAASSPTGFRRFVQSSSVYKYLQKMSEHVHKLLTQDEKDALQTYQGGSGHFNSYLRNKDVEGLKTDVHLDEQAKQLDSAIAKSPSTEPVTVYRWVESWWFKIKDPNDFFKMVGAVYNDRGYGSTSLSKSTEYTHRNVLFSINVPQGYGLIPADAHHPKGVTSFTHGEQEMVIARNTHYRISSVTSMPGNKVKVTLDVLPDKISKMDLLEAVKKMTEWQNKASSAADDTPGMTEAEVQQLLSEIPGMTKKEVPTLTDKIETQEEKTLKEFVQSIEEFFGESESRAEFDSIMEEFGLLEKESNEYVAAMRKATNCYLGA